MTCSPKLVPVEKLAQRRGERGEKMPLCAAIPENCAFSAKFFLSARSAILRDSGARGTGPMNDPYVSLGVTWLDPAAEVWP